VARARKRIAKPDKFIAIGVKPLSTGGIRIQVSVDAQAQAVSVLEGWR